MDEKANRGRSERRAQIVLYALLLTMIGAGVAFSRDRDEPVRPTADPVPPSPRNATELVAIAADGSRVTVRRNGDWLWARIDSAGTNRCRRGTGIGYNFVEGNPRWVRGTRSFVFEGTYETTAALGPIENVPKSVSFRMTGRFTAKGAAAGEFTRRDVIEQDGTVVLDCRRATSWAARRG